MEYVLIDYNTEEIIYNGDLGEYNIIDTPKTIDEINKEKGKYKNTSIRPISILTSSNSIISDTISSYNTEDALKRGVINDVKRSIVSVNGIPISKELFLEKANTTILKPVFSQAAVAIPFIYLRTILPEDIHLGELPDTLVKKQYNNNLMFDYNDTNDSASIEKKICSFSVNNNQLTVHHIYDIYIYIDKTDSIININTINPKNCPIFISNY